MSQAWDTSGNITQIPALMELTFQWRVCHPWHVQTELISILAPCSSASAFSVNCITIHPLASLPSHLTRFQILSSSHLSLLCPLPTAQRTPSPLPSTQPLPWLTFHYTLCSSYIQPNPPFTLFHASCPLERLSFCLSPPSFTWSGKSLLIL